MSGKKFIFILLLLSIFLVSFSSVCAAELNESAVETQNIDDSNGTEVLTVDSTDEACGDAYSETTANKVKYTFSETGSYYGEAKLHVSITNASNGKGIEGKKVGIYVNDKLWNEFNTDSNGLIDVDFKKNPGDYNLKAKLNDGTNTKIGELDVTIIGIPTNFGLNQNGAYYKDTSLTFKLTNLKNGKPVKDADINVQFSNGKSAKLKTDSKGTATYEVAFKPGTYSVTATTNSKFISKNKVSMKFTIGKTYMKIAADSLSTTYNSAKTLKVKLTNYFNNNPIKKTKINLKIYTGKKCKTVTLTTDSKGTAKYDISKLSIGSHKITISNAEKYCDCQEKSVNVKVTKAYLTISAPNVKTTADASKNFRITVKNKETGKAVEKVKVNVKVYTGKKCKTYNLKTNSKGQIAISTEGLDNSIHNVVISIKGNGYYYPASCKSKITIANPDAGVTS